MEQASPHALATPAPGSHTPTKEMAEAARAALARRAKLPPSRRAMTPTGLARARDIANRKPLSLDTVKRMVSFFARHGANEDADRSDPDSKWRQAWDGWGGDPGRRWAQAIVGRLTDVKNSYRLAAVAPHHDSLPPLPTDPLGRYTRWILLTDTDGFHALNRASGQYEFVAVDAAWIDDKVAQYGVMQDGQYDAPLQAEHSGAVTAGQRLGDVLELRRWTNPATGKTCLIGAVAFAIPDAEARINLGQIRYFSPGFGSWRDERGRAFTGAFLELSLTTQPQQIGKGATHVLSQETGPMDTTEEVKAEMAADETVDEDTMPARMERLESALAALTARLDAMSEVEMMADEDEPEVEMSSVEMSSDDSPTVASLSAALSAANATIARLTFDADFPEGRTLTVSLSGASVRDALFALHQAAPGALQSLLDAAQVGTSAAPAALPSSAGAPSPPVIPLQLSSGIKWDATLGAEVPDPAAAPPSKEALWEEAKRKHNGATPEATAHFNTLKAQHGLV